MKTIFVQIASYRDSECKHTIHDLYEKAVLPERIHVGLNWQYADEDGDFPFFDRPYRDRIRLLRIPSHQSKGCCWARSLTESLYGGEDYVLNIDAHMRFSPGWDERLITLHQQLVSDGHAKPVISYYPPAYTLPGGQLHERISKMLTHELSVNNESRGLFINSRSVTLDPGGQPYLQACVAGGFLFAPGSMIREVPYDPHLYFFGEEITLAVRLWTHGYDLFHPACILAYHLYQRQVDNSGTIKKSRAALATHQGEHAGVEERTRRSYARVRHLCGTQESHEAAVTQEMIRYGLGNERTLYQYSRFSGLDFQLLKARPFSKLSIFYRERLPLGDKQEITALEAAEAEIGKSYSCTEATTLSALLSATNADQVLDVGAHFADAVATLGSTLPLRCYQAISVSPERVRFIREKLKVSCCAGVSEFNYAAEPLHRSQVVVAGGMLSRVPLQITWQLLDSIYASGSRFLCVAQEEDTSWLCASPFYLPNPVASIVGHQNMQWDVWDLISLPNLFEPLPAPESRARRIIVDSLADCVSTLRVTLAGHTDMFQALLSASRDHPKNEAAKVFENPELRAQCLLNGGGAAMHALDLWWCLRRRNFNAAKSLLRHQLLDTGLEIDPYFMQSVAWDYFESRLPLNQRIQPGINPGEAS